MSCSTSRRPVMAAACRTAAVASRALRPVVRQVVGSPPSEAAAITLPGFPLAPAVEGISDGIPALQQRRRRDDRLTVVPPRDAGNRGPDSAGSVKLPPKANRLVDQVS